MLTEHKKNDDNKLHGDADIVMRDDNDDNVFNNPLTTKTKTVWKVMIMKMMVLIMRIKIQWVIMMSIWRCR